MMLISMVKSGKWGGGCTIPQCLNSTLYGKMPKKTVLRNKPQRPTARRTQLAALRSSPPSHEHHEAVLVGLTDPFSSEAAQARYPDQGAGRTLTFQQRITITRTADANGIDAIAINPKVNYPYLAMASAAGSVITWNATWSSNNSTNLINTYGTVYRPTSIGVRLSNTLSATDSSGRIIIAKGGTPVAGSTTTFSAANFTEWEAHPYQHGGELHTFAFPRSSTAYGFQPLANTNADTQNGDPGWQTVYIAWFGVKASVNASYIEVFINYEYVALEDSPIAQLAVQQPVLDIAMQTAVNAVQTAHPVSHRGTKEVVKGFVKKEAKKALLKHVLPFAAKKATQLLL